MNYKKIYFFITIIFLLSLGIAFGKYLKELYGPIIVIPMRYTDTSITEIIALGITIVIGKTLLFPTKKKNTKKS